MKHRMSYGERRRSREKAGKRRRRVFDVRLHAGPTQQNVTAYLDETVAPVVFEIPDPFVKVAAERERILARNHLDGLLDQMIEDMGLRFTSDWSPPMLTRKGDYQGIGRRRLQEVASAAIALGREGLPSDQRNHHEEHQIP